MHGHDSMVLVDACAEREHFSFAKEKNFRAVSVKKMLRVNL
jgi:hypothetical protein